MSGVMGPRPYKLRYRCVTEILSPYLNLVGAHWPTLKKGPWLMVNGRCPRDHMKVKGNRKHGVKNYNLFNFDFGALGTICRAYWTSCFFPHYFLTKESRQLFHKSILCKVCHMLVVGQCWSFRCRKSLERPRLFRNGTFRLGFCLE